MTISKKRFGEVIGGICCISFGLFLGICSIATPVFTRSPDAYYNLKVTLSAAPVISKGHKQPDALVFKFKEYPNLFFGVNLNYCSGMKIAELRAGDTALITVQKVDYRRVVNHEGNFFERLVSNRPDLFGLTVKGKNYIDINKIASGTVNPVIASIFIVIVVFAFIIGGIANLLQLDFR